VAGSRCAWRPEGPELNALVIDRDGKIVRRGCIGDGIQHLQVASDGTIWVGYFDEGVFGNFGWGGPGPQPLGAAGIVAWSPTLEKIWELDPEEGLISDCYAMNVHGVEILACPYTDFPVLRLRDRQLQVFPTQGISGPRGILAAGDDVALIGTYGDHAAVTLGRLEDGRFLPTGSARLRAPDGSTLRVDQLVCKGPTAHVFAGPEWFTYDLGGSR